MRRPCSINPPFFSLADERHYAGPPIVAHNESLDKFTEFGRAFEGSVCKKRFC